MPNVVRKTAFSYPRNVVLHRSYGRNFDWRANRERLQRKQQPTITNEDGTKTLRLRPNAGNRQRPLPLSPIMDPIAVASKQRYRTPKAKPPEDEQELSEFSRALAANPYAQALATPIRSCSITRARLPTHFLQPCVAHFRVHDQKLKGYIGLDKFLSNRPESELEAELGGHGAGFAPSKAYALNSQELIAAVGRKKKTLQVLVSQRMRDEYDKRTRALGRGTLKGEDWTWLGSVEQTRELLIEDVRSALKKYMEQFPDCKHLVPLSRLDAADHAFVQHPRDAVGASATSTDQASEVQNVLVPAYDIARLELTERVKDLNLDSEITETSIIGILQTRETLKLHLALQKLAMFLGAKTACQFIVMKKQDCVDSGYDDHLMLPYLMIGDIGGHEPGYGGFEADDSGSDLGEFEQEVVADRSESDKFVEDQDDVSRDEGYDDVGDDYDF